MNRMQSPKTKEKQCHDAAENSLFKMIVRIFLVSQNKNNESK